MLFELSYIIVLLSALDIPNSLPSVILSLSVFTRITPFLISMVELSPLTNPKDVLDALSNDSIFADI